MSGLDDLRKRVEACEAGGDREIDAAIWCALCPSDVDDERFWRWRGLQPRSVSDRALDEVKAQYARRNAPDYTSSLDAALALVERTLPGWTWVVGMGPEFARASLSDVRAVREQHAEAHAAIPALALLAALLQAQSSLGRPEE